MECKQNFTNVISKNYSQLYKKGDDVDDEIKASFNKVQHKYCLKKNTYIFDYIFIGEHEIKLTKFWDVQEQLNKIAC